MKNNTNEIANWLLKCGCANIAPVQVTIGKETWNGCRFSKTHEYTAGMQAVTNGTRKVGEQYVEDRIYLVGKLPKGYHNGGNNNLCFPFEGKDWYVAGYYQGTEAKYGEFHPFGPNFIVAPWDIPDSKIDDGEPRQYQRVPMSVEPIK